MTTAARDGDDPHVRVANWLFGRLVAIVVGAAVVVTAALSVAGPLGPAALVLVGVVSLVALWLVVRVAFAALSDLLEAKLEAIDRRD